MDEDYANYRIRANLSYTESLVEDLRGFLYNNLFILRIGKVETFDEKTQEATCTVDNYRFEGVKIKAGMLQNNIKHKLKKDQRVMLIQTITDLDDEKSFIYFDRGNFKVLSVLNIEDIEVKLKNITVEIEENMKIKTTKNLEVESVENLTIKAKNADVTTSAKLTAKAENIVLEPTALMKIKGTLDVKGTLKINGNDYASHKHGAGTYKDVDIPGQAGRLGAPILGSSSAPTMLPDPDVAVPEAAVPEAEAPHE